MAELDWAGHTAVAYAYSPPTRLLVACYTTWNLLVYMTGGQKREIESERERERECVCFFPSSTWFFTRAERPHSMYTPVNRNYPFLPPHAPAIIRVFYARTLPKRFSIGEDSPLSFGRSISRRWGQVFRLEFDDTRINGYRRGLLHYNRHPSSFNDFIRSI